MLATKLRYLALLLFVTATPARSDDVKSLIKDAFIKGFIGDNPWGGSLGTMPDGLKGPMVDPFAPPVDPAQLPDNSKLISLPKIKAVPAPPFDPVNPFPPIGSLPGKPAPAPPVLPGDPFQPAPPGFGGPGQVDPATAVYEKLVQFVDKVPGSQGYGFNTRLNFDGRLVIELLVENKSLKDPYKVAEILSYIQIMRGNYSGFGSSSYGTWFEILRNAKVGDPRAIAYKAKTLEMALEKILSSGAMGYNIPKEVLKVFKGFRWKNAEIIQRRDKARLNWIELERASLDHQQKITKQWTEKQKSLAALDKQRPRLNEMIARNDRKGVATLLEKYMPWPLMSPTEVVAWEKWIEAIRNPAPPEKRRLVHRGIGGGERLYKGPAGQYLMSNFLRMTRGNYNERLRSLSEMRLARGTSNYSGTPSTPVTMATMMVRHSADARSSPFISSSVAEIAKGFTEKGVNPGVVSMLIDDRRIMKNAFAAGFGHEVERLIPLMVFPDEVIAFQKAKFVKRPPPPTIPGQPGFIPGQPGITDPFLPLPPGDQFIPAPSESNKNQPMLPGFEAEAGAKGKTIDVFTTGPDLLPAFGSDLVSTIDLDSLNEKTQSRLKELGITKYLNAEDASEWADRLMVDYLKKTAKDCNSLMIEYHVAMKKYL